MHLAMDQQRSVLSKVRVSNAASRIGHLPRTQAYLANLGAPESENFPLVGIQTASLDAVAEPPLGRARAAALGASRRDPEHTVNSKGSGE